MRWIVFTDMDGTLLDHDTYSYEQAKDALLMLKEKNIPLIVCTSKTRAEIVDFRKKIGITSEFLILYLSDGRCL